MIGDLDQILGTGRLADQHTLFVIFVQDGIDLVALCIYLIRCGPVFGQDEDQLILSVIQNLGKLLWNEFPGEHGPHQRRKTDGGSYAVHLVQLLCERFYLLGLQLAVQKDHMCGIHLKILLQLFRCLDTGQILGKGAVQIVIDFIVCLSVIRRDDQYKEKKDGDPGMLYDPPADPFEVGEQRFMPGLLQRTVEDQDHGGKHRYTADHAEDDALCHDDTHIQTHGKAHEHQSHETGHCGNGAAYNGGKSLINGISHSLLTITVGILLLSFVAVPQEDGIVHGDRQLQHRRQGLGHIRYLSLDKIRSQIVDNCHTDGQQEEQGNQEGIHGDHQHRKT